MDTKVALTCLVTPFSSQIDNLRKQYDTAYERWPTHFNIDCFPFYPSDQHQRLAPIIQAVCQKYAPMNISLNKLNTFQATKKQTGTLYAEVTDNSGGLLAMCKDIQQQVLPMATTSTKSTDKRKELHLHVTLGRFDDNDLMTGVKNSIEWVPVNFVLHGLDLIVRTQDTSFVSKYFFPFGKQDYVVVNDINDSMSSNVVATNDEDTSGNVTNDFAVRHCNFNEFHIYKIRKVNNNKDRKANKPKVMNVLVIDNSGSMGHATREATNSIGSGMFNLPSDKIHMVPGMVLLFDSNVSFNDNIRSAADLSKIVFPNQGQTNITLAIQTAIGKIISHYDKMSNNDKDIHYILTFLSDGGHNNGPVLTTDLINGMSDQVRKRGIKLSIIIVGIVSNDTSLGMKVKTGLETITISSLDSVYYAKTQPEMRNVISQLNSGLVTSLCQGLTIDLKVNQGTFIENLSNNMKYFINTNSNDINGETVVAVKATGQSVPQLLINGCSTVIIEDVSNNIGNDVALVVGSIVGKLSQIKIANGNISKQVEQLDRFIDTADTMFELLKIKDVKTRESTVDDIGKVVIKAGDRLSMIKKIKQAKNNFQEERNKLLLLKVAVDNDSAKQAEYLTGINKKYAGKAVIKADVINVKPTEVVDQLKLLKDKLQQSLAKDKALLQDHSKDLSQSILSLNNPVEQLSEWLDTINNIDNNDFTDVYSLLVCFGFPAYVVKFDNNNAVQMDPFQTSCNYLESTPIDTSTLMLSNQLNNKLLSPAHVVMTDGLILVDPACPNTSLLLMRTMVYQYLCSATLCRDLYMYHPKMTFAMHAHALVQTIDNYSKTRSTAHLDLALRIVYSIRKFWTANPSSKLCTEGDNFDLFKRWFHEWDTITQSEKDSCNHPVQLLLMLAAFDVMLPTNNGIYNNDDNSNIPIVNLLNEVLARKMKQKLSYLSSQASNSDNTKEYGVGLMQKLFGITADNSPKPNPDTMTEEPTLVSVRESCQMWADVDICGSQQVLNKFKATDNNNCVNNCVRDYVNEVTLPYLRTAQFALAIQKYMRGRKETWTDVICNIESEAGIPTDMLNFVSNDLASYIDDNIFTYLGVTESKDVDLMANNMFMQAVLCHDSSSRVSVNQKSVFESSTFHDMIVDLRMANYFEACKVKKQLWLSIIGDVTFEAAFNGDANVYEQMIGTHTHGHTKDKFWALLRAAKNSKDKLDIFTKRSNGTIGACLKRI